MPRLERKTQQIFCNSADSDQLAVFGSMATGTPVYSNDIEELQSNEAYQVGWDAATLGDKAPFMEEMNGLQYGITRQLAYLLQQGISEWDAGTTYYIGNFVAQNSRLYISLTDNNIGNSPIDSADNWQEFSSGGGVHKMFDPVLQDHILSYKETKGLALQGTYVYKEAVAGSRYGYPTFYDTCVKEFRNASNTQEYLSSNVNVTGSLVNTKGVLSGFSDSNYAVIPEIFAPSASDTWEMVFSYTTGSDVATAQSIKGNSVNYSGALIRVYSSKFQLYISSNTSSWNIASGVSGTYTVLANTKYWVKLTFDGTQYILSYSLDGKNYTDDITVTSTTAIGSNTQWVGRAAATSQYARGTIDLNESYININGSRWWSGVDTVTRNPNGHLFYDINDKSVIDEYYIATGRAWMYGVDTENERIFLPRNNKYFRIGDEDTVGTNQDAGLPNITGKIAGGLSSKFCTTPFYYIGQVNSEAANAGGEQDTQLGLDFSRSNPIYGNSDTVELDSVNMLLYICVGNTEAEEALTDVTEITTSENDTLPWGYHFYSGELLEAPIGYIESLGQWNDGSGLYAQFYSKAVNKIGEAFASGYIKEYTETYDDYDLVINQDDLTFRLPLLDGSEDLPSEKYEDWTLLSSGSTYTAPANGWYSVSKKTGTANAYLGVTNTTANLGFQDAKATTTADLTVEVEVKKGDVVSVTYSASGATNHSRFIYAQGNGSLYFKVANAVQNLELLNAGEVLEAVNNVIPNNRTVWDGQWVQKYLAVMSKVTAVGSYTYDLSDYLPNDGYTYEVMFDSYMNSANTTYFCIGTQASPYTNKETCFYYCAVSTTDGKVHPQQFFLPIDSSRKVYTQIYNAAISATSHLFAVGYRRIGTNV